MWTRDVWNQFEPDGPCQRTVVITLDEYRELVSAEARNSETCRKKDEEISELRRKVQRLTDALSGSEEEEEE